MFFICKRNNWTKCKGLVEDLCGKFPRKVNRGNRECNSHRKQVTWPTILTFSTCNFFPIVISLFKQDSFTSSCYTLKFHFAGLITKHYINLFSGGIVRLNSGYSLIPRILILLLYLKIKWIKIFWILRHNLRNQSNWLDGKLFIATPSLTLTFCKSENYRGTRLYIIIIIITKEQNYFYVSAWDRTGYLQCVRLTW